MPGSQHQQSSTSTPHFTNLEKVALVFRHWSDGRADLCLFSSMNKDCVCSIQALHTCSFSAVSDSSALDTYYSDSSRDFIWSCFLMTCFPYTAVQAFSGYVQYVVQNSLILQCYLFRVLRKVTLLVDDPVFKVKDNQQEKKEKLLFSQCSKKCSVHSCTETKGTWAW